jgi:hypothetical protein
MMQVNSTSAPAQGPIDRVRRSASGAVPGHDYAD